MDMSNITSIGPIRLLVNLRHSDNSNIDLEAEGEQEEHQVALSRPPRQTYGDANQVHGMCYDPCHVVIFFPIGPQSQCRYLGSELSRKVLNRESDSTRFTSNLFTFSHKAPRDPGVTVRQLLRSGHPHLYDFLSRLS